MGCYHTRENVHSALTMLNAVEHQGLLICSFLKKKKNPTGITN